jgi:hypothetical protein
MEDWKRRWFDKTTEPYTVVHVEKGGRWAGSTYWDVYYRAYSKRSMVTVKAADELGAYMAALKRIKTNKRKTDQLNEKSKKKGS